MRRSCSSYSVSWGKWASSCSSHSSPWACICVWAILYNNSSSVENICADELPPIAQAGEKCVAPVATIIAHSGPDELAHVAPIHRSPCANMRRWYILYSSSFENMGRRATLLLRYSSSRENMCSSCSSRSSPLNYARKELARAKRWADLSEVCKYWHYSGVMCCGYYYNLCCHYYVWMGSLFGR